MYVCIYVCLYRMHHKHLTGFEIRKPTCQLRAPFVLPVITYSLVEMECWSLQHRIAAVDCLSKKKSIATQCGFCQQVQT